MAYFLPTSIGMERTPQLSWNIGLRRGVCCTRRQAAMGTGRDHLKSAGIHPFPEHHIQGRCHTLGRSPGQDSEEQCSQTPHSTATGRGFPRFTSLGLIPGSLHLAHLYGQLRDSAARFVNTVRVHKELSSALAAPAGQPLMLSFSTVTDRPQLQGFIQPPPGFLINTQTGSCFRNTVHGFHGAT